MTMRTARDLLEGIGIGHVNATMIIPYLPISPATTDPKSGQIIAMVRQLQKELFNMGATDVANTGYLDEATGRALEQLSGPDWMRMSWGDNLTAIVNAKVVGTRITPQGAIPDAMGQPVAVGGPLDFLPDVPGGLVTYGIAAFFLYRYLRRRS